MYNEIVTNFIFCVLYGTYYRRKSCVKKKLCFVTLRYDCLVVDSNMFSGVILHFQKQICTILQYYLVAE